MPYKYIRKSTQQSWEAEAMQHAIEAVRRDKMPFATAAKQFNVPRNTLKRRVLEKNRDAIEDKKILGKYRKVFTELQEMELCEHIFDMEQRFYGITLNDLRYLAYSLAEKNNIPHPFNKEKEMAGKDWVACFRKRHPNITLRKPEATSMARAQGFNKTNVNTFFNILKTVQDNHFHPAHRIYNVDETGLLTVQTRSSKVFSLKGRRQVGAITSAEKGLLSTFAVCMSAGGTFIPPFVIFPRQKMKAELKDGAPPGSEFACNPSGWMQTDIFMQWFDHFLKYAKPSAEDPALLILDGHATHTKNVAFIEKARENHITVVCLPPHCSHKLQPLDVSFMAPFKAYYIQACEKFLRNNAGRTITQFQISKLLGEAFLRAAVPATAINGFRKCGIFPLDPDVFSDADFVAAEVSDIPMNPQNNDLNVTEANCENALDEHGDGPISTEEEVVAGPSGGALAEEVAVAGSSGVVQSSFAVSPKEIISLPKQTFVKQRKQNRKKGRAAVITSSPYKNEVIADKQKKEEEEAKKRKRMEKKRLPPNKKHKPKSQKKTQTKKASQTKKQLSFEPEEEEEDDDEECFYCNEAYSKSKDNEGWIRCLKCKKWAHEECAGCEEEDDEFECEFCK